VILLLLRFLLFRATLVQCNYCLTTTVTRRLLLSHFGEINDDDDDDIGLELAGSIFGIPVSRSVSPPASCILRK